MISKASDEPRRLSKESGFTIVDIFRPTPRHLPSRTPGLLAFLYVEDEVEKIVRLLLLDDLAKGFAMSRPFCGNANLIAYRPFVSFPSSGNIDQYRQELAERLKLYAQLTVKYKAPQVVWPLDEFATIPPP